MKTFCFFIMSLLCLHVSNAQSLETTITLTVKDKTLADILKLIEDQYQIRFSYINNELPVELFSSQLVKIPVSKFLDQTLAGTDIGYQDYKGTIILKKGLLKNENVPVEKPDKVQFIVKSSVPKRDTIDLNEDKSDDNIEGLNETVVPVSAEINNDVKEISGTTYPQREAHMATSFYNFVKTYDEMIAEIDRKSFKKDSIHQLNPIDPTLLKEEALINVGLIYPFSNYGAHSKDMQFNMGLYFLTGKVKDINGGQLSIGGNHVLGKGKGVQIAGLYNQVENSISGVQVSGLLNYVKTGVKGVQLGSINVSSGLVNGTQIGAGFNLAHEYVRGGQISGGFNLSQSNVSGVQIAPLNLSDTIKGVQVGAVNLISEVKGGQLSAVYNKANRVHGIQFSVINQAKSVYGVQIGAINVVDSIYGTPIGLVNFVKKDGYRRFELYYADDFQVNATFKMGARHFYNIFSIGAEVDGKKRWGAGAGFGSEWRMAKLLRLNTDLMSYYVSERGYDNGFFHEQDLNLLNKLKALFTLQIGSKLSLFGGPVLNVMVSKYQESPDSRIGSTLPQNPFYDRTFRDKVNLQMWVGYNAGIRF